MEILNLFQETIYWPDIVREQRFAQQSERMQNLKLELALTSSIYAYPEIEVFRISSQSLRVAVCIIKFHGPPMGLKLSKL